MNNILKDYNELIKYLKDNNIDNIFMVSFKYKEEPLLIKKLKDNNIKLTFYHGYTPNPKYEEVLEGLKEFNKTKSKCIIALGGGSCIDVAKCIKGYATLDPNKSYLEQEIIDNDIILIAVPTTAGTGSESTRYSVIYKDGVKQSVHSNYIIPNKVLFDSSFLVTLPIYQKKATMLDTFSHAIESFWSVNRNTESIEYAKKSLELVLNNKDEYIKENKKVFDNMLLASYYAGCAINITATTAGHALAYKLTTLYGISHGHATALINSELLPYMIENTKDKGLLKIFDDLKYVLKLNNINELKDYIRNILDDMDIYNVNYNYDDLDVLVKSVNLDRLKNNPYKLNEIDIKNIYINLFKEIERRK